MSLDVYTYLEMREQIGSFIQDTSTGRAGQINEALNREYAKAVQNIAWPQLLRFKTLLFGNSNTLYLPKDVITDRD